MARQGSWSKLAAAAGFIGALLLGAFVAEETEILGQELSAPKASATFEGTCTNHTYNLSAKLAVNLELEADGTLGGSIVITGVLYGSGPLTGHTDGKTLNFVSIAALDGVPMEWAGTIQGREIYGTYQVKPNRSNPMHQFGSWHVALEPEEGASPAE